MSKIKEVDIIEQVKKEFTKLSDSIFTELRENMAVKLSGKALVNEEALENALTYLTEIGNQRALKIARQLIQ